MSGNPITSGMLLLAIGVSLLACAPPKFDLQTEIAALTDLQKQEQTAHLEEQPALLVLSLIHI